MYLLWSHMSVNSVLHPHQHSFFNCSPGLACLLPVTSSCFSCTCSKSHSLFWIWMQLYFSPIRKKMVWVWKRICSVFFVVQPQVLPMVGNSSWLVASLLCFQREKVKKPKNRHLRSVTARLLLLKKGLNNQDFVVMIFPPKLSSSITGDLCVCVNSKL